VHTTHLSPPDAATTDEERVVAAFNAGRAHSVRVRGRAYTHKALTVGDMPKCLSACRFGRLPIKTAGAPPLEYTAGYELGTTFWELARPLAKRVGDIIFQPPKGSVARGGDTKSRDRISLLGLLETIYSHNTLSVRAVAAALEEILAAPLDKLLNDAIRVSDVACVRIQPDAIFRCTTTDDELIGYGGTVVKLPGFARKALCVRTVLEGARRRMIGYAVPFPLSIAEFGTGPHAARALDELVAKMLRWMLMDTYLRMILVYPPFVYEHIDAQRGRKSAAGVTFRPTSDLFLGREDEFPYMTSTVMGFGNACALIDPANLRALHAAFMAGGLHVLRDPSEVVLSAKLNTEYADVIEFERKMRRR
jgi:hypothetical protein